MKSNSLPLLLLGDESKANIPILDNVGNDETRNKNYVEMENDEDSDIAKDIYSNMEDSSDSKDSEWIDEENIMNEHIVTECYDLDDFDSASESDTELESRRKKALRKLRKEHEKRGIVDNTAPFHVVKNFPNKETVRKLVYAHVVATRRQLYIWKNHKERIRVVYRGKCPIFNYHKDGPSVNGPSVNGPNGSCLTNIGVTSLQKQGSALKKNSGSALKKNSGSALNKTVKLDVERWLDPSKPTTQFRRIYICLGALKKGFKAGMRDLLGLDGCFMKGKYPGQLLTDVGVDANHGTYPLAYDVVEAETLNSWSWFPTCLGDDLDLTRDSNFTFMSDRQKGLIPAITQVFQYAKHRFCLRHIHENMNLQFKGDLYKELLWNYASATSPLTPVAAALFKAITDQASFYKHDMAALWDEAGNKSDVGIPESLVHACYWLVTWKKKMTSGGVLSRVGKTVTCDTCKKPGHNKRSCKNGAGGSQPSKMSAATPIASQASAARGPQRFAAIPISSQWSAATPRATQRSVATPRTSQRYAATPRTSQRTAATAKGKEKVV
ncbi:mutator type transposase [Tanacetum coccineum]